VGEDFHFGRNRGGNVELLRRMGPNLGFEVEGLTLVPIPGFEGPVSSTAIRRALETADVVTANRLLGRPHEVRGVVEKGDGRGGTGGAGVRVKGIDPDRIPTHIGCVMDGNGRWAEARGLPRTEGHKRGEDALFEAVEGALELGVKWLTVYAFSTENWRRPPDE